MQHVSRGGFVSHGHQLRSGDLIAHTDRKQHNVLSSGLHGSILNIILRTPIGEHHGYAVSGERRGVVGHPEDVVRGELDGAARPRVAPQVRDGGDCLGEILAVLVRSQKDLQSRRVAVLDDGHLSVPCAHVKAVGDIDEPAFGRFKVGDPQA